MFKSRWIQRGCVKEFVVEPKFGTPPPCVKKLSWFCSQCGEVMDDDTVSLIEIVHNEKEELAQVCSSCYSEFNGS